MTNLPSDSSGQVEGGDNDPPENCPPPEEDFSDEVGFAFEERVENCSQCGNAIGVARLVPFSRITCPHCQAVIRVLKRFHHFSILSELGEGGMGTVYRAYDPTLKREVALKLLFDEEGTGSLAEHEAALTASINHPHVVRVFSTGVQSGFHFIAMEILPGGTLQQMIRRRGRLTEFEVLRIGIQVAEGLRAAHSVGLLHRDIKPGNILFCAAGVAKVADFGLALKSEEAAQGGRELFGSAFYVAPERIRSGGEDVRSDIYSLGATLFEALAGRPPFGGTDVSLIAQKHITNIPPTVQAFAPDVSQETSRIFTRTLAANPADRYPGYDALIANLKHAQNLLAAPKRKRLPNQKARQGMSEQWIWSLITVFMLLAGLALVVWWTLGDRF